jgi:predicted transcriptional regulator
MTFKIRVYEIIRRLFNKNLTYVPTRQIISETGGHRPRVYRALRYLEKQGVIERQSRQSGWRPAVLASCIYGALLRSYRLSHKFVQTDNIARQLNQNPRVIRGELSKLELAQIVQRHNQRGGWQPVRQPKPPANQEIILTLEDLFLRYRKPLKTKQIARQLKITERHARRLLADYEQRGLVARAGQRLGWQLLSPSATGLMLVAQ